ncbi:MAG: histidinol-phosphate transaminase [Gemmatimonadota bacterium]
MKSPDAWVRPHVRRVEPYTAARHLYREGLFLDANENPYGSLAPEHGADLNRYPDPTCGELRRPLAEWLAVEPERIWIGNGSDEGLDRIVRAFVEPGEPVVIAEPTYAMYRIVAETHGARIRNAALDDAFDVDPEALLAVAGGAKAVFLCSPNNPTGNALGADRVTRLAEAFDGLVVVDEAYVEFSERPSLASRTREHRNLVVLRTFSKAWGLAGARVGYLVADPEVVGYLNRVSLPYPLSVTSLRAAAAALTRVDEMEAKRARILAERTRLAARLAAMGYRVFPSQANFLLVRVPAAREVYRRLAGEFGIIVRDRSRLPRLEDCLRVSVGRPKDTERLCAALETIRAR